MDLRLKNMKLMTVLVFLGFSYQVKADWFSKEMNLKERIELTRQIGKQSKKNAILNQGYKRNQYKQKTIIRTPSHILKKDQHNIKMILNLPLQNRIQSLSNYGPKSFTILKNFVSSEKEKMPVRWKALVSLARLYPNKSLPIVQKSLGSTIWFLRNAGLIAMEIINPKESVRWAGQLLNDPSLIVRTASVNMIRKHKARQYKMQLIEKLNAPDSFYKNRSLWIRHHIASTLADFYEPGEEKMFISFLRDPDERLHPPAIAALERLTGKTFHASDEEESEIKKQKKMWISWWSDSHNNKNSIQL